jgi:hypothetical protein
MESKRFTLNRADVESWFKTALVFLAPVALIYTSFVQQNMVDGFEWEDFVPNLFVQGSMVGYVLAEITALIKKFVEGK